MIEQEVVEKFQARYTHVHPLIFQRSLDRAKSANDLFDILETIPKKLPIVWNDKNHCWEHTNDIVQVKKFNLGEK